MLNEYILLRKSHGRTYYKFYYSDATRGKRDVQYGYRDTTSQVVTAVIVLLLVKSAERWKVAYGKQYPPEQRSHTSGKHTWNSQTTRE